jgi:hypothetical protein
MAVISFIQSGRGVPVFSAAQRSVPLRTQDEVDEEVRKIEGLK